MKLTDQETAMLNSIAYGTGGGSLYQTNLKRVLEDNPRLFDQDERGTILTAYLAARNPLVHGKRWRRWLEIHHGFEFTQVTDVSITCRTCGGVGYWSRSKHQCYNCNGTGKVNANAYDVKYKGREIIKNGEVIE